MKDPRASVIYVLVSAILHKQKSHFVFLITEKVGGVQRSAAKVNEWMCFQGLAWTRRHGKGVRHRVVSICWKWRAKKGGFCCQSSRERLKSCSTDVRQAGFLPVLSYALPPLLRLEAAELSLGPLPTSFAPLQSFYAYPGIDLESARNDLPGPARLTKTPRSPRPGGARARSHRCLHAQGTNEQDLIISLTQPAWLVCPATHSFFLCESEWQRVKGQTCSSLPASFTQKFNGERKLIILLNF